jgi:hypothetical protein
MASVVAEVFSAVPRATAGTNTSPERLFAQEQIMTDEKHEDQHRESPPPESKPKVRTDGQRLDEGLDETFPASDPVSVKDIE